MAVDELGGRPILVTGGTGFIGRRLCAHLRAAGISVHTIARGTADLDGVTSWRGDLTNREDLERILTVVQPKAIVHLAGRASGDPRRALVRPMFEDNFVTTLNVLEGALSHGLPRVVLAGSMVEREDPTEPVASPYAAAKMASNVYARLFARIYEAPVVQLRLFMVYGEGQTDERKLLPYLITSLLRGETPRLTAGRLPLDWLYIDDACEAIIAALSAREADARHIDVASGRVVTGRETAELVRSLIGSETPIDFGALDERPLVVPRVADLSRAETLMGWRPRTSLEEGLTRVIRWYRERAYDNASRVLAREPIRE